MHYAFIIQISINAIHLHELSLIRTFIITIFKDNASIKKKNYNNRF